jgi:hypothetical protein
VGGGIGVGEGRGGAEKGVREEGVRWMREEKRRLCGE